MTSESETLARLLAYHDHIDVPQVAIEDDVRRGRQRVRRNRGLVAGGAALAVATVVATGAVLLSAGDGGQEPQPLPTPGRTATPSPTPTENTTPALGWSGAVRDGTSWPRVNPERSQVGTRLGLGNTALVWIDDAGDAAARSVDIRAVGSQGRFTVHHRGITGEWRLDLAEAWPRTRSDVGPADGVIEYGVVVDTDGDRVADCQIGINDGIAQKHRYGDYRVWVTNLRSGVTKQQIGGPYGFPIDFALPDEIGQSWMSFFFLSKGSPCWFRGPVHYYTYASATDADGNVTAWDFAPNAAWLKGTGEENY